jgi:serine kinase of HPr protein (carbohydrate metabolism regulator)
VIVHASAVALRLDREWRAVLLFGESGAGKSDLALRALDLGWRLVADDYASVWRSGDALYVRAPDRLAGLIEARGIGVMAEPPLEYARVRLAVDCGGEVERMPDPETFALEGVELPRLRLDPFEASALAKLGRVLSTRALGAAEGLAYLDASRAGTPMSPSSAEVDKRLG